MKHFPQFWGLEHNTYVNCNGGGRPFHFWPLCFFILFSYQSFFFIDGWVFFGFYFQCYLSLSCCNLLFFCLQILLSGTKKQKFTPRSCPGPSLAFRFTGYLKLSYCHNSHSIIFHNYNIYILRKKNITELLLWVNWRKNILNIFFLHSQI